MLINILKDKLFPSIAVVTVLILSLPILVIAASFFAGTSDIWSHLYATVLSDYVLNSLYLVLGVSFGVLLIGIPTAWLTSSYDFPGKDVFSWALLLPLAFPAYIIAYTYTGMLDFAGPVQIAIRAWTGWVSGTDYRFFSIRSLFGAIIMLTLVLYPYVYLLGRAAFLDQSASILEVGRTLGYSHHQSMIRLVLPIARPAIMAGLTLTLMETLADFGTVQYFGVSTFTTGIFRVFYSFGDTTATAQLSTILLAFIIVLIGLERYSRGQLRYHTAKGRSVQSIPLSGSKACVASACCFLPLLLGFLIPVLQLSYWALCKAEIRGTFFSLAWNSFYLAFLTALIAVFFALLLAYTKRLYVQRKIVVTAVSIASVGYALPGAIIAIGVIISFAWIDHQLINIASKWFSVEIGLLFSNTLIALIFAYNVRFLAVSFSAIDSGLEKIKLNLDNAARLLGRPPMQVLKSIHLPLLNRSILTALLIVFVDVLKELPITLILRPFNFNTLSVRAYELASDERLIDAAPASLSIILVGLLPVILLSRSIENRY